MKWYWCLHCERIQRQKYYPPLKCKFKDCDGHFGDIIPLCREAILELEKHGLLKEGCKLSYDEFAKLCYSRK